MENPTLHHQKILSELCRICGNRAQTFREKKSRKTAYFVTNCKDRIKLFFDVCTENDDSKVHPDKICTSCFGHMTKFFKHRQAEIKNQNEFSDNAKVVNDVWNDGHSLSKCPVCDLYERQKSVHRGVRVSLLSLLEDNQDKTPKTDKNVLQIEENGDNLSGR